MQHHWCPNNRYVLGDYCENATEICMAMAVAEGRFHSLVVHEVGKLFGSGQISNGMHSTRVRQPTPPSRPPVSPFCFERAIRRCGYEARLLPRSGPVARRCEGSAEIESNSTMKGRDSGMTLKGKRSETLELHASPIRPHAKDISTNHVPHHDEIRLRAYEIYLEHAGILGRELDDWLQAESEFESAALFMRAATGEKHRP